MVRVERIFFSLKVLAKIEKNDTIYDVRRKSLNGAKLSFIRLILKKLEKEGVISFKSDGTVEGYVQAYKDRSMAILKELKKVFDNKLTINQSFHISRLMFGIEKGDNFCKIKQKAFFHNSDNFVKDIINLADRKGFISTNPIGGVRTVVVFRENKRNGSEKVLQEMANLNLFNFKRQPLGRLAFILKKKRKKICKEIVCIYLFIPVCSIDPNNPVCANPLSPCSLLSVGIFFLISILYQKTKKLSSYIYFSTVLNSFFLALLSSSM